MKTHTEAIRWSRGWESGRPGKGRLWRSWWLLAAILALVLVSVNDVQAQTATTLTVQSVGPTRAQLTTTIGSPSGTMTVYFRHRVGSGAWTIGRYTTTDAVSSHTVTGLIDGTAYEFQVSLASDYSSAVSAHHTHVGTTLTVQSVGPTRAQLTTTIGSPSGTMTVYFRHRVGSGAWTIGRYTTTDAVSSHTVTGLIDGTAYEFQVSLASDYSSAVSAHHTHVGTTMLLFDLRTGSGTIDRIVEITDITDATNISVSGTVPTAMDGVRAAEEFDGWVYSVVTDGNRTLWRSRTPTDTSSYTNLGTLPSQADGTHSLFSDSGVLYGMTNTTIYRILDPTSPADAVTVQNLPSGVALARGAVTLDGVLYLYDHTGDEIWTIPDISQAGTGTSSTISGTSGGRAMTLFNGRVVMSRESARELREIQNITTNSPTSAHLSTYSSAYPYVNAIAAWSGDQARIISSAATSNIKDTGARVTLTLSSGFTGNPPSTYLDYRPTGSSTWTRAPLPQVGGTAAIFNLDGLTAATDYEARGSLDENFPSDATATATFTTQRSGALITVIITVGTGGSSVGFGSSYGTLDAGAFSGDLFMDGNDRTVASIREDSDGYWYLEYSGGAPNDWITDSELLDEIAVTVKYESGADTREFVLGGFVDSRPDAHTLKLEPPLPSRDWDSKVGQEVAFEFRRLSTAAPPAPSTALTDPTGEPGSFVEWLAETTPGGPVVAQSMMVVLVYVIFLYKTPATPRGVLMAAVVLILTPWVPMLFGFGDLFAAAVPFVNIVAGAFSYKSFVARTES